MRKKVVKSSEPSDLGEPQASTPQVGVLRPRAVPSPPAAVRVIKRVFVLDHELGETVVTIKGPAGAVKLVSSQTSLSVSTDGEPEVRTASSSTPRRTSAPARQLSGDPTEPGGTVEAFLPGDDEGAAALALRPDSLSFLREMERSEMRRASSE